MDWRASSTSIISYRRRRLGAPALTPAFLFPARRLWAATHCVGTTMHRVWSSQRSWRLDATARRFVPFRASECAGIATASHATKHLVEKDGRHIGEGGLNVSLINGLERRFIRFLYVQSSSDADERTYMIILEHR